MPKSSSATVGLPAFAFNDESSEGARCVLRNKYDSENLTQKDQYTHTRTYIDIHARTHIERDREEIEERERQSNLKGPPTEVSRVLMMHMYLLLSCTTE